MVLLLHEMPDGSSHFDWMVERAAAEGVPAPDDRVLVTYRVNERIDDAACRGFLAERLADHRARYLDYEGEVLGREGEAGRGRVRRVALGTAVWIEDSKQRVTIEGAFAGAPAAANFRWVGTAEGERWTFVRSPRADERATNPGGYASRA